MNGEVKNSATVTVTVNGKNDIWPKWGDPPYDNVPIIAENAPSGAEILTLIATDDDTGLASRFPIRAFTNYGDIVPNASIF